MEAFSQLRFISLDDSNLCQVDKNQPGQVLTIIVWFGKCKAKRKCEEVLALMISIFTILCLRYQDSGEGDSESPTKLPARGY